MIDIEIIGNQASKEGEAAIDLRKIIENGLPDSANGTCTIIISKKVYGRNVQDIDLVMLLHLREPVQIGVLDFRNLLCTIEVKNVKRLEFPGGMAEITNPDGSVDYPLDQSNAQKYALLDYLFASDWKADVQNFVWFRLQDHEEIYKKAQDVYLGNNFDFKQFVEMACATGRQRQIQSRLVQSIRAKEILDYVVKKLTAKNSVSELDRKKIDEICTTRFNEKSRYITEPLNAIISGAPGTGKTIYLLSIARYLYEAKNERVIFLTYNKVLVMDVVRLMFHLGISDAYSRNTIKVQTIHSFLHEILKYAKLLNPSKDFLKYYSEYKQILLKEFGRQDFLEKMPTHLKFHRTLVDEGQDWPDDERDILYKLNRPAQCIISTSESQLIRSGRPCNWQPDGQSSSVNLSKIVRSKRNIVSFIKFFSKEFNLSFETDPEFFGGEILILEGPYSLAFHQQLVEKNEPNRNFDMLFLVPPSLRQGDQSVVGHWFGKQGFEYWDTTSDDNRNAWPTSLDAFRIVPYDSCRGIEGWVTVCLQYQDFFAYKTAVNDSERSADAISDIDPIGTFIKGSQDKHYYAAKWSIMPFSRAANTLVIQLDQAPLHLLSVFKKAHEYFPEFITWHKSENLKK